jgi:hypothetical protein
MRTITFYSYKGGVGRSLLVANTAKYLSTLGKSVFALDLDLEAPGLHYKFHLGSDSAPTDSISGVVDILAHFLREGTFPKRLGTYTKSEDVAKEAGPITIMRAGTAPHGDYWRALSRINWYDLFYGTEPIGAPFFLELQQRIRDEFNPDFLLIDSRTGITDMGGVATTLLPDTVVCLALASLEHLEGLRAVMQGIHHTTSQQAKTVRMIPVISRLLLRKESALEVQELAKIRSFLNQPVKEGSPSLNVDEVVALHSEPLLDSEEQLLVGGKSSPYELPLLRDYLKLFSKTIPAGDIRPHVGMLIQRAVGRLLDDPDGAQSDLEALTTYCADAEAYSALLKLYQVRKAPLEKIIATAALMWQLRPTGSEQERFLEGVIEAAYTEPRATDLQKKYADFAEEVWRASGMRDVRVGINIANAYAPERRDKAIRLLSDYVEKADSPSYSAIVRLINMLRVARSGAEAFPIIDRFKANADDPSFHAAWARLVVAQDDPALVRQTLQDKLFRQDAVRTKDPITLFRFLKLGGLEIPPTFLLEATEAAVFDRNLSHLEGLASIFMKEGKFSEFEDRVRQRVPRGFWNELTDSLREHGHHLS